MNEKEIRRAVLSCLVQYNDPIKLTAIWQYCSGYCRHSIPGLKRWDVQLQLDYLMGSGIVTCQTKGKTSLYALA